MTNSRSKIEVVSPDRNMRSAREEMRKLLDQEQLEREEVWRKMGLTRQKGEETTDDGIRRQTLAFSWDCHFGSRQA
jgi:hypothetical protein